jgi:hypothetical protein
VSSSRRAPSVWFALALLGLDAALVIGALRISESAAALGQPAAPESGESGESPKSPKLGNGDREQPGAGASGAAALDSGWAYCQTRLRDRTVMPVIAALTYLEPVADAAVTADEIRGWLGDLDLVAVDVYKLVHQDGTHRVALELSRSKWPVWDQVVGAARGEEVCSRVRAALRAHGVGRPRTAPDQGKDAMYDFEFIYARRPRLYRSIEWVGTLDEVLEQGALDALHVWLAQEGL